MDNKYNYPKKEVNTAQLELNTPSDIAKSFFPQAASLGNLRSRRSTEKDEPQNRKRRLIDAVAALPVGTRFSVGEPFKETACNALSIFFLCDSREHLDWKLDQVTKRQVTQQQASETVQDRNKEKFALLRDETRLTQKSVERTREETYAHIF